MECVTIVINIYIRSPEPIYLITESLNPVTKILPHFSLEWDFWRPGLKRHCSFFPHLGLTHSGDASCHVLRTIKWPQCSQMMEDGVDQWPTRELVIEFGSRSSDLCWRSWLQPQMIPCHLMSNLEPEQITATHCSRICASAAFVIRL